MFSLLNADGLDDSLVLAVAVDVGAVALLVGDLLVLEVKFCVVALLFLDLNFRFKARLHFNFCLDCLFTFIELFVEVLNCVLLVVDNAEFSAHFELLADVLVFFFDFFEFFLPSSCEESSHLITHSCGFLHV